MVFNTSNVLLSNVLKRRLTFSNAFFWCPKVFYRFPFRFEKNSLPFPIDRSKHQRVVEWTVGYFFRMDRSRSVTFQK